MQKLKGRLALAKFRVSRLGLQYFSIVAIESVIIVILVSNPGLPFGLLFLLSVVGILILLYWWRLLANLEISRKVELNEIRRRFGLPERR